MDKLWILTEEKPKVSVIKQIVQLYKNDFNGSIINIEDEIIIKPIFRNEQFEFRYEVIGIQIANIDSIIIKTVSGSSSFFDFLVFKQENQPEENEPGNLLMAIEETKTSDDESRNTGVYQRASKFAFIEAYYTDIKLYMLYNNELEIRENKKPSDTSIFGTNMLLTLGVDIVGKDTSRWFNKFNSIDDMIHFKSQMRKPPAGNIPIEITRYEDHIEISGRLSKPSNAGNIGHDPNIGALSLISKCLRSLGWEKDIVIMRHGVSQEYIDHTHGNNKFLFICSILNIQLADIEMPAEVSLPDKYWHYEMSSEKMASILLHIVGECHGMRCIYQNHAGCERGYFKTKRNELIALPKKDLNGVNLYIPDLVLHDPTSNTIILVEGKKLSTLANGISEIENYDSIENEFIKPDYPECNIYRCVSIFGGELHHLPHEKVILYLNIYGDIYVNEDSPECIKDAFIAEGITLS